MRNLELIITKADWSQMLPCLMWAKLHLIYKHRQWATYWRLNWFSFWGEKSMQDHIWAGFWWNRLPVLLHQGPHTTTDGKMDFQLYLSKSWVIPQENNPKKHQRMYTKRSDSDNKLKFLLNDVQDWATATGRTWSVLKLHFCVIIFGTLYLSTTLTFMFKRSKMHPNLWR